MAKIELKLEVTSVAEVECLAELAFKLSLLSEMLVSDPNLFEDDDVDLPYFQVCSKASDLIEQLVGEEAVKAHRRKLIEAGEILEPARPAPSKPTLVT